MKILIILEAGGGVGRHVVDLVRGLRAKHINVVLAYSPLRMDAEHIEEIDELTKAGLIAFKVNMRRAPGPWDFFVILKLLKIALQCRKFDLVHGHSSKGGALARIIAPIVGAKSVYTPHAFYTMNPGLSKWKAILFRYMETLLSAISGAVIVTSEQERDHAASVIGIDSRLLRLVYNGSNKASIQSTKINAFRVACGVKAGNFVIGFIGRFEYQKAPEHLIMAFAKLIHDYSNIKLVMVGDGSLRNQLQILASELGIANHIIFPGFYPSSVAMEVFDVFVLPSRYEGSPYVLHDAALASLPIICTPVGGADILLKDKVNGYLIDHGNVNQLAQSIEALLMDRNLTTYMGLESAKLIANYSIDRMIDNTFEVYSSLFNRRAL